MSCKCGSSNCCSSKKKSDISGLGYSSPAHGGWGMVRVGMLVPDAHQLFVCPFACGRHGAIGALTHKYKKRLSYLYIDEADIVSGSYEELIIESVDELLQELDSRPRALLVFVSCIDDLMGTDHDALLKTLKDKHPDMDFGMGHMNPITSDGKLPPAMNIQKTIYSFLSESKHRENFVLISGCNTKINNDNEIYDLLSNYGYDLKHISDAKNYDEYLALSSAKLNLVTNPLGVTIGEKLEKEINLEMVYLPNSYDIEKIKEDYTLLFKKLGIDEISDFSKYEKSINQKITMAKTELADKEISIDDNAIMACFGLAKFLHVNGFNVKSVCIDSIRKYDKENYKWIKDNTDIEIIYHTNHDAPKRRQINKDVIALGYEAGYYYTSSHTIGLNFDDGLYGFKGIETILEMLVEASKKEIPLEELINEAGLVV